MKICEHEPLYPHNPFVPPEPLNLRFGLLSFNYAVVATLVVAPALISSF